MIHGNEMSVNEYLVLNSAEALRRLGDDDELYAELITLFLEDSPLVLGSVEEALSGDERLPATISIHSLKSSASSIGAEKLRAACAALEAALKKEAPTCNSEFISGLVKSVRKELDDASVCCSQLHAEISPR